MREDDFKTIVNEAKETFAAPSISAAVLTDGQVYRYAIGQRGLMGGAVDSDTVYQIASASKAFIATCVMMLVDEGRLELDAPVKSYLPEFQLWTKELTEQVTVRDILTHRTGLPRHDVTSFTRPDAVLAETIAYLRWLEPCWGLRERFGYQNHMFALASYLVERITGQAWSAVVRERIFTPLGLRRAHTAWLAYERYDDNYARPLITRGTTAAPIDSVPTDPMACAGSLSMSAMDLLRWGRANLEAHGIGQRESADGTDGADGADGTNGTDCARGQLTVSGEAVRELHCAQMPIRPGELAPYTEPLVNSLDYGLGWFVERYRGVPLVYHGGTLQGFKSVVGFMPEHGMALAVLVNQNDSPVPALVLRQVADAVLGVQPYDWRGFYLDLDTERQATRQREYKAAFAEEARVWPPEAGGVYEHPAYGQMRLTQTPDGPRLAAGWRDYPLRPGAQAPWVIDASDVSQTLPCQFVYEPARAAADPAGDGPNAPATDATASPHANVAPADGPAADAVAPAGDGPDAPATDAAASPHANTSPATAAPPSAEPGVPLAFCAWLEPELKHPIRFERVAGAHGAGEGRPGATG
ncbi:MAG: beta-lactamase family protein [Bifidobacteriaceae bacterium]|jgi:CubicO group peptidase (beta-lactamase class C family)|nr:beta-lactamase family protein [Bifidobacteriaceae bacterium]